MGEASSIAVIGGGVIGVELSQAFSRLGVKTTVYEATGQLLPGIGDRDASLIARRALRAAGVETLLSTPVERVACRDSGVEVCARGECRVYDYALIAIGRRPRTSGIGLEEHRLLDDKGFIRLEDPPSTPVPNVYAAGDATGQPFLAHKAVAESLRAAARILGERVEGMETIPVIVYGEPEIVVVKRRGKPRAPTRTVKNYWGYNAVARIKGYKAQLVYARIEYEEESGRIVAATVAGPHASELATPLTIAIEKGLSIRDLAGTIHPHPSASEALWDTVLEAIGYQYNRA